MTQPLKVVQIIMCRLLGVATVVLTTNVSGREDLFKKFTTFLSPSLLPDSLYKDISEGGHSGPIVQVNAPPSVSLPDAVTSDRCYRYERLLNRTTSTFQLELVSYNPIGADRLRFEPIIINLADIAPKHHDWVTEMLLKGACLVANNTSAAIDKARNLINMARAESFNDPAVPVLQFTLTIDEADDFIRTDMCARLYQTSPGQLHPYTSRALHTSRALPTSTARSTLVRYLGPGASNPGILLEQAVKRLCQSGPLIKFNVTATLLAIYLMLQRLKQHGRSNAVDRILADDIIYIQPSADYVGTESFVPLERNGQELYLTHNELNNRNDFCSSKVEAMYDDAAGHQRSPRQAYGKGVAYAEVNGRGVIYVTSPGFFLWALDAKTGRPLENWGSEFPVGQFPETGVIDLIPKLVEDWGPWQDYVVAGGQYDPDYGIPRELGMVTASAPPIVVNGVVVVLVGHQLPISLYA